MYCWPRQGAGPLEELNDAAGRTKLPKRLGFFFSPAGIWWKECWASWLYSDPGSSLSWLDIPPGSF